MKIFILVLFVVIGSFSLSYADTPVLPAKPAITVHAIMGGVVKSVSWADSTKGTKSEIVVKDVSGKSVSILVTSTTTLWGADAKAIDLDKTVVKRKVNVIYLTTDEGINVGKSIKILK